MYIEFNVGEKTYKLRLTTKGAIQLERALGYNPISMLLDMDNGVMPKLGDMITILHATLQPLNHGISMDDACDIYDNYIATGKTMFDLIPVFVEVFQESGFIAKDKGQKEADEKN